MLPRLPPYTEIEKKVCCTISPCSLEIESGHGPVNDAMVGAVKYLSLLVFCTLQYIVSILFSTSAYDYVV